MDAVDGMVDQGGQGVDVLAVERRDEGFVEFIENGGLDLVGLDFQISDRPQALPDLLLREVFQLPKKGLEDLACLGQEDGLALQESEELSSLGRRRSKRLKPMDGTSNRILSVPRSNVHGIAHEKLIFLSQFRSVSAATGESSRPRPDFCS